MTPTDNVYMTLLNHLYTLKGDSIYLPNEEGQAAKRRKMISLLDEEVEILQEVDADLARDYEETISYLERISNEEYEFLRTEIVESVTAYSRGEAL